MMYPDTEHMGTICGGMATASGASAEEPLPITGLRLCFSLNSYSENIHYLRRRRAAKAARANRLSVVVAGSGTTVVVMLPIAVPV